MTDLTIVFVNFNMKEDILRAAETVLSDAKTSAVSVNVVVVDNSGNRDGMKEALASRLPSVHYVDALGNIGFGKANTLGFKTFPARYYFALNRDTLIPEGKNILERIVAYMDTHPLVGIMGPKLLYPDGRLQNSCYRFNFSSIIVKPFKHLRLDQKFALAKKLVDELQMADFDHNSTRPVDWILGAAIVARGDAIADTGWFDERYFMYLEDCDWCHTMWSKNWPVHYVHDIEIIHTHDRASAKVPGLKAIFVNKVARIHAISWIKYLLKWFGKHKSYAGNA